MAATEHGISNRGPRDSADNFDIITISDTIDVPNLGWGLYVATTQNVTIDTVGGDTAKLIENLAGGIIHPIRVKRVRATGTGSAAVLVFY